GPLLETIRDQIKEAHLDNQMLLPGPLPQEEVQALLREADVLALPCVVAESGDRDGIPVVLMEAMALGVPVVSTTVSGIPELITSGQNGLLGTPNAPETLANALEKVLGDTDLARSMARAARATIETEFNVDENAAKLYKQFSKAIHGTRE
ncbi:MAG: glycosyltransferase, partial [Candidatus Hydrogenedentes bacterium]|nr:glycosyltransferase [Candidatus Hydrogenedentota bacterium]